MLLIKVEFFVCLHILHWATESEKYIILTLFYDQNYVNLSNLKFHPLCHTKSSFFLKITQLHFYLIWFENIANVKISGCLFVIQGFWTKLSQYSIWTFLIMIKKTNYALCHFTGVCNIYYFHYSVKNFDILKTCEFSIYCKHVICQFKQDC